MGEIEGELVRVSRRAVAARVGLWMNPVNGRVCVYVCVCVRERGRHSYLWDHRVCGSVDKGGLSSTWRTWIWAHGQLCAAWNGGHAIVS